MVLKNAMLIFFKFTDNFVEVIGESVKNRRCNIAHLEPTADSVDVSGDADSIKAALADL